jgi:hypothetical protein
MSTMNTATKSLLKYIGGHNITKPITITVSKDKLRPFFGNKLPAYSLMGSHSFSFRDTTAENVQVTVAPANN